MASIAGENAHKSAFVITALTVVFITLLANVHCGSAQSSTSQTVNSNLLVTASEGVDGAISPNGVFSISYGSSQVFTVTPGDGHIIDNVLVNGTSALHDGVVLSEPYSFTVQNVTGATSVSATFTPGGSVGSSVSRAVGAPGNPGAVDTNISELSWFVIVPLLLCVFSVAVIVRHRKRRA